MAHAGLWLLVGILTSCYYLLRSCGERGRSEVGSWCLRGTARAIAGRMRVDCRVAGMWVIVAYVC